MNREEQIAIVYEDYLDQQSDIGLANIFYDAMNRLTDKNFMVRNFVRKEEFIDIITELDYTGKLDAGFEDTRKEI